MIEGSRRNEGSATRVEASSVEVKGVKREKEKKSNAVRAQEGVGAFVEASKLNNRRGRASLSSMCCRGVIPCVGGRRVRSLRV